MRKLMLAITLIALFGSGCSEETNTTFSGERTVRSEKKQPKITYTNPVFVQNSDYILYPLFMNKGSKNYESRDTESNYWNLIFYNVVSGKSELLTKTKIVINDFTIGNPGKSEKLFSDDFIYYKITNTANNGDKKLTGDDPKKLFISNLDGKLFTQISPENYSLLNWRIDSKHSLVLMDLIKDTNSDQLFNDKDEIEYFVYSLIDKKPAKPIFDKNFTNEVEQLAKTNL